MDETPLVLVEDAATAHLIQHVGNLAGFTPIRVDDCVDLLINVGTTHFDVVVLGLPLAETAIEALFDRFVELIVESGIVLVTGPGAASVGEVDDLAAQRGLNVLADLCRPFVPEDCCGLCCQ